MNIIGKLEEVRRDIETGTAPGLANRLQREGIRAIFEGMRKPDGTTTDEWRILMRHFANNDAELARLCGEEPNFNTSQWGYACLAYIMGNSTCTSETARQGGTVRGFTDEMKINLDAEFADLDKFQRARPTDSDPEESEK